MPSLTAQDLRDIARLLYYAPTAQDVDRRLTLIALAEHEATLIALTEHEATYKETRS